MIEFILQVWLLALEPTPAEVTDFAAVTRLPEAVAREHLLWSAAAAYVYDVPVDDLRGLADHESAWNHRVVTREPGHRVSCGIMTPVPKRRCTEQELTIRGGWMAGAAHYREWYEVCRGSRWCAIIAYAGGLRSVRQCARTGRVLSHAGHNVCDLPTDVRRRARRLHAAIISG